MIYSNQNALRLATFSSTAAAAAFTVWLSSCSTSSMTMTEANNTSSSSSSHANANANRTLKHVFVSNKSKTNRNTQKSIELSSKSTKAGPLSKTYSILYKLNLIRDIKKLTLPRILSQTDPIFKDSKLQKGLKQRAQDETKLLQIQVEIQKTMNEQTSVDAMKHDNDEKQHQRMELIRGFMNQVNEIAYGKGITPQQREDFLIKYGCTAYTDTILQTILNYTYHRGIIEIGAGNGQWTKAIFGLHTSQLQLQIDNDNDGSDDNSSIPLSPFSKFIVAYDNQSSIPLNTDIYHQYTKPAQTYFFQDVENLDGVEAVGRIQNRGRALLMVYPPPGEMALDVVNSYANFEGNDLVIYVGEGIGGANANRDFFDYFLNHSKYGDDESEWCLLDVCDIPDLLGGNKGFEMMYILKKVKKVKK
mmetsp:Transcript_15447/g.17963  ORF Transcript_15447/g.17963 Transcript_15447/m.17963 type:complete len:417 (+) Transcript_15447:93-1343(+)